MGTKPSLTYRQLSRLIQIFKAGASLGETMSASVNLGGLKRNGWHLLGLKDNAVVTVDGGHDDIVGVVKALKLHKRICGEKRYEGVTWRAALLSDVPELDVPINEEAAELCAMTVKR